MSYWKDRQSETLEEILKNADVSADEIANIYAKSSFYINNKIQGIFDRYRSKYGLGIQEAKILLNQLDDPTSYDEMIKHLRNLNGDERQELLKKLESPAYKYRINRLQEVQNSLDSVMSNIYNQEKKISTLSYVDAANDSYYKTIFNIQKNTGVEFNFSNLNPKHIDTILRANWSGKNYSERIWNNTQELSKQVKEELLMGILVGKTEREMSQTITEKFQVANYKARRLIQTESAYISTMMDIEAYKEAGIDTMRFVAMHDLKTSKKCQQHDGKYVKIEDAVVGSNVPPLHPNCRSFMEPVIDEELDKNMKRRVKDENGHYKIVDANETYDEWYKRMQEEKGVDTVETLKKKTVNFSSDRKQYYEYMDIIGKENMPKTFADFQDMKYNDFSEWYLLKKYKKSRHSGKLSAFSTFDDYKKYRDIIQTEIVGLTTQDGIKILSQSDHFIERVLGMTEKEGPHKNKKREGVRIEDIISSILHPQSISEKAGPKGRSRKYIGENVEVTINPDTKNLIQTNPKKKE